ncbi:hypothetical protein IG193_01205 [Infirmifilum lucidum]|uniref:Uncharacterized protein n=1 Tax=Infirmifilum lucidum TaxID=2776706 RepID=A0A7L9FJK6_9CREN|nr:hypothetical protein [Infirmifilum lucidum]QOJ79114.1 hypothetical protein IG193_01205 [Infirmifilum lucidum]
MSGRPDLEKLLAENLRHAVWEAERVLELGEKWFEMRDEWSRRGWEATWCFLEENPTVRDALLKELRDKP